MMPTFDRPPPEVELLSDKAGYASVEVRVKRRWEDTAPGVRTPVDAHIVFGVAAGDYCAGPEWLTVEEARALRDLLDKGLQMVAEREAGR